MFENHKDKPRDEIMKMADEAIKQFKDRGANDVYVNFKFTCPHCGERCSFQEKNHLFEEGECFKCGKNSKIERAGFSLAIGLK